MTSNPIGIAACTWGLEPDYTWVPDYEPAAVLASAARLGFAGIEPAAESGPGGLVAAQTKALGLTCPARFVGIPLHDSLEAARRGGEALADLQDLGARLLLVGIESEGSHRPLIDLARRCSDLGITAAIHPELGGPVATAGHIDELLAADESLAVCLDTGHLWAAGDDDLPALVARWGTRIAHIHLKDVAAHSAAAVQSGSLGVEEAVRDGLWQPLGAGSVPLQETLEALSRDGYTGWLVVEDDFAPQPEQSAQQSLSWLRSFLQTGNIESNR